MNNKTFATLIAVLLTVVLIACQSGPKPIKYGTENCFFCSMTIVDKQYAAEIITNKGKIYTFDAIECMINYFIKEKNESELAMYFTVDYMKPGKFIDAEQATYLISKNIPSPMGAFLSAFSSEKDAKKMQEEKQGKLYTWDQIVKYMKKNKMNQGQEHDHHHN